MLPITHGASGRAVEHGTFVVSTQATNQALVDGVNGPIGGCRKRGRRGRVASPLRGVDEGEAMPPQPQADDLETLVARLQETVESLVGMVEAQSVKINQQSEMMTSLANQVVQQAQVGERNSDVSVHDFLMLKPPVFAGTDQEDPLMFIRHMERIFDALGCSSQRSVKFAALQLHYIAATNRALVDGVNGPIGGCRNRGRCGSVASPLREDVDEGEAMRPQPQADDLETFVARLQETVESLVGIVEARSVKINQQSEMITSLANQVVQQAQVAERNSDVSLHDFLMLKPPVFAGSDEEDASRFINDMEKIFEELGCSSQRSVTFAALQLHGVAATWYDFLLVGRSAGLASLTWDKFKEAFMARFLPESVRSARAREFETLRQTPSMSVSEYDIRFTQLSCYAPNHDPTEREMITRFVMGLDPSFTAVVAAIDQFPSFAAAVDFARRIEMRKMEKMEDNASPRMEQGSVGKSAQCGLVQKGRVRNPCTTCGKHHIGQCYKVSGACFQCGQVGHFKRDCPQLQSESSLGSF